MVKYISIFFSSLVISGILYFFTGVIVVESVSSSADNATLVIATFGFVILILLSFIITMLFYIIDHLKNQHH